MTNTPISEKESILSQEYLKSILDYDPETGIFRRKYRRDRGKDWNARFSGKIVGGKSVGRVRITLSNRHYLAHRLAWFYMTGNWPKEQIDHINLNPSDNRFVNLREATHSQNMMNTGLRADNVAGLKGVSWRKDKKKWGARIRFNGVRKKLGYFDDPEAAYRAYCEAAAKYHGDFSRTE